MKTPASLLQRVQQGTDQQAWSRLVQLYLPLICFWGRRMGLQNADVADLAQEVFAVLWRTLPTFTYDRHKSFRNWLRTVTFNKCRELHRRRGLLTQADEDLENLAGNDGPNSWEEEHNHYLANRALQLMRADFDGPTWQACWATIVEERPTVEVAQQLGLSVPAVYAAKSRVLRRLRQELEGLW